MSVGLRSIVALLVIIPFQFGCSYMFGREVVGRYADARDSLVGYMTFHLSDHKDGSIAIGTARAKQCRGQFGEVQSAFPVLEGLFQKKRRYEGTLFCLDGLRGHFFLETANDDEGSIEGKIGERAFTMQIQASERQYRSGRYDAAWEGSGEDWRNAHRKAMQP